MVTRSGVNWPGKDTGYVRRESELSVREIELGGPWLDPVLPPACQISLPLALRMRVRVVAARTPWFNPPA